MPYSYSNDITVPAGDSKKIRVVLADADKNPVNLDDSNIVWKVAKQVSSNTLIEKTNANTTTGITVVDSNNGIFEIMISPIDTVSLGGKTLYHECKVQLSDSTVATVLSGELYVDKALVTPDDL